MGTPGRRTAATALSLFLLSLSAGNRGDRSPWVAALAQGSPCGPNPIVCENQKPGHSDFDIAGAGDSTIQGFATDISVNTGQTVDFKINTDSANYEIAIYRLGYYNDAGARKVATLGPFAAPQNQPACSLDATTGLADCGNWQVSASWSTAGAASGIYIAKLNRLDTGGSSHIVFVVRDDARRADVVVQTSDTTWQAYNQVRLRQPVLRRAGQQRGHGLRLRRACHESELQPPDSTRARTIPRASCSTPNIRWCASSRPTGTTSST